MARRILIRPNDPRFTYAQCIDVQLNDQRAEFDRPAPDTPYHVDSPCASIRFRTDSEGILAPLSIPGYKGGLDEAVEPYRAAARRIVAQMNDERLFLIKGPELVPNEMKYFPDDGIHPGDWGFAKIAANLAARIKHGSHLDETG